MQKNGYNLPSNTSLKFAFKVRVYSSIFNLSNISTPSLPLSPFSLASGLFTNIPLFLQYRKTFISIASLDWKCRKAFEFYIVTSRGHFHSSNMIRGFLPNWDLGSSIWATMCAFLIILWIFVLNLFLLNVRFTDRRWTTLVLYHCLYRKCRTERRLNQTPTIYRF